MFGIGQLQSRLTWCIGLTHKLNRYLRTVNFPLSTHTKCYEDVANMLRGNRACYENATRKQLLLPWNLILTDLVKHVGRRCHVIDEAGNKLAKNYGLSRGSYEETAAVEFSF